VSNVMVYVCFGGECYFLVIVEGGMEGGVVECVAEI